jgi:hypothetical protein
LVLSANWIGRRMGNRAGSNRGARPPKAEGGL